MKDDYNKALVEVLEIIKYLPEKEKKDIPQNLIDKMIEKKDKNYYFSLDRTKPFYIQVSGLTKAILANIFKKYWANNYELKVIKAKENSNRAKCEEMKRKLFPVDNIFKKS